MEDKARQRLEEGLVDLLGLGDSPPSQAPQGPAGTQVFNVSGGSTVFVGNGNTVSNIYQVRPKITVVQTGVGVLDAAQKARLLELRDQIVGVSRAMEGQQVSAATVMRKLNAHMGVNSYAEILGDQFSRAEGYLARWRAKLDGMPGANRSRGWRDRRVKAIHTRCKELGLDRWRINYMRKAWNKESLIDLADDQLEQMYLAVMRRKKEEDA